MSLTRRDFVGLTVAAMATGPAGAIGAQSKPATAGIAPTGEHVRQRIDGFGFCEAFHAAGAIQNLGDKERNALLDLMFSPTAGMGYSILRNQIGNGPANSRPGQVASIEPEQGKFQWTGDEDQVWLMQEAMKRGCSRFIASSWSAPAWMKTSNDEYMGDLKPDMYQAFAEYLATYVSEYKSRFGIEIYAVSPQNEPSFDPKPLKYASMRWSPSQMKKFLRENLIPTFKAKGVAAKIFVDEHNDWNDAGINEILSDPVCSQGIEIVAAHAYASTSAPFVSINSRTGRFETALKANKTIWQTEISAGDANITNMNDGVYWARVLHTHLIEDNVSAWLYWWGAAPTNSRGTLISIDPKAKSYELSKRFFTIGHYARFIRPGFHRVDATPNPYPNVFFSAFLAPNGKQLVCVAINDDAVQRPFTLQLGGFAGTTCIPIRTSTTEVHKRLPNLAVSGGVVDVTTSPLSVTTFVIA